MHSRIILLLGLSLAVFSNCRKNDNPEPPDTTTFRVNFHNSFNILEAQYAAFLSDADGKVLGFRWLPGNDTAQLTLSDVQPGERFDCTVVKVETLVAPGTGLRDTTITVTTYTNLFNEANIYFRNLFYTQTTDLSVTFTGVTSIDSIIVPDGLTFARPQSDNNFAGEYRILHTGQFWVRLLINGESNWRYAYFDGISEGSVDTTLDASVLPQLAGPVGQVSLPLLVDWEYKLDGVLDLDQKKFLSIGDLIRAPGGAIPVFDQLAVFQPPGVPFTGYRLRFSGYDNTPGSYGYTCDWYFETLPTQLQSPGFDVLSASVADKRWVSIQCSGFIDLLSFTRTHSGTPHLSWEALVAPTNNGSVTYRLPEIPDALKMAYPVLQSYNFDPGVRVRAEGYETLNVYPEVISRRMRMEDPLWQMKAGYIALERRF
ncbi:MAG: hypothetical protein EP344_17490 [Bacteroidetes bacterium]|nr:MAG: hypothetical protein EP344_17490 [Bacteroidota bacterium]